MANKVAQLSTWMITKATTLGWTIAQCRGVTIQQVFKQLPEQYREHLTQIVFLKAKQRLVFEMYRIGITTLKDNTTVRQEILAVFPDADFRLDINKKHIIIDLEGTPELPEDIE